MRNVAQMIDDIDAFRSYGQYRIGTVILHRDRDNFHNIVDGQQRFITFCLISHFLADRTSVKSPDMANQAVPELGLDISRTNMVDNYAFVRQALSQRPDCEEWAEFFLDSCELVVLTVGNLDEAFQMFDSQNTRGRALYPTDLLKAFHIREMSSEHANPDLRLAMVRLWEEIPPESINELFSDYLFKIKRWANGHDVPIQGLAAEHIDLFKGIREADPRNGQNRWAMPYLYAKNYTDDFRQENATLIRYRAMPAVTYPFQIDQPVINGETFFLMVRHYYELGLRCGLFPDDPASETVDPLPALTETLEALAPYRSKSTHRLVRNLFDCLLLYYVDRFGVQDLSRAAALIVRFTMALRVQQRQVRRVMVNNYALGNRSAALPSQNLFEELREAMRSQDFLRRVLPTPDFNGYPELHGFFATTVEATR